SDDNIENEKEVFDLFIEKVLFLSNVNDYSITSNLKINRLALETALWMLGVLDLEEQKYNLDDALKVKIANFIDNNFDSYTEVDYGFNKQVYGRYSKTGEFLLK